MKAQLFRRVLASSVLAIVLSSSAALAGQKAVLTIANQKVVFTFNPITVDEEEQSVATGQPAVTGKDANVYVKSITEIGNMVSPMVLPRAVQLNLAPVSLSPSANPLSNDLNMGVRFGMYDAQGRLHTQNPSIMIPVVAHEFGHLIFAQNIMAKLPIAKGISDYSRESSQLIAKMTQLQNEYSRLEAGPQTAQAKARMATLESMFTHFAQILDQIQKKYQPVLERLSRTSAYNEFFADVVSTLYTESPNAIAEAIHFAMPKSCGTQENPGAHCSKQRSDVRRSEIENRQFDKVGSSPHYIASQHALFASVRRWLWKSYLQRPSILKNQKKQVLFAVAKAILEETTAVVRLPSFELDSKMANALNQRLAQKIQANLANLN